MCILFNIYSQRRRLTVFILILPRASSFSLSSPPAIISPPFSFPLFPRLFQLVELPPAWELITWLVLVLLSRFWLVHAMQLLMGRLRSSATEKLQRLNSVRHETRYLVIRSWNLSLELTRYPKTFLGEGRFRSWE